jgi:hypothetical protein
MQEITALIMFLKVHLATLWLLLMHSVEYTKQWSIHILKTYPRWDLYLWAGWVLYFLVLEFIGLYRLGKSVPLTWTVRDTVPLTFRLAAVIWLGWHFVGSGANR